MKLPQAFVTTIRTTFGEEGNAFLRDLPTLLEEYAQRWALSLLPPFDNLSYNYVAPAICRDGAQAVIKLGVPHRESRSEIEALDFYAGEGCARLLAADPDRGALLLERLYPGAILRPLVYEDDEAATAIVAGVMGELWRPAPPQHSMLTIGEWAAGLNNLRPTFDGGTGPFPAHLVDAAERLFPELLASSGEQVILHGDLHHDNVLSAQGNRWLAIDPKGVAGEREFEVYALLRNPLGWIPNQPNAARILARRIDQVAERLELDRDRMRLWSVAQCVLSAWWDYGDSEHDHDRGDGIIADGWRDDIYIAELLWNLQ